MLIGSGPVPSSRTDDRVNPWASSNFYLEVPPDVTTGWVGVVVGGLVVGVVVGVFVGGVVVGTEVATELDPPTDGAEVVVVEI